MAAPFDELGNMMKATTSGFTSRKTLWARQSVSFLFIGALLVVIDGTIFVLLTTWGLDALVANITARFVGVLVGFVANGRWTFSAPLGTHHFLRYLMLWLVMTALSTSLVSVIAIHLSLHTAWLGKFFVEAVLAIVSFGVSRHWVYRKP
jgi:putative flippase GtrA